MNFKTDPRLSSYEQETHITTSKGMCPEMRVFTNNKTIMKYLYEMQEHGHAEIIKKETHEGSIVSVTAVLPVNCLSLKSKPRKTSSLSSTVSFPSNSVPWD